MLLLLLLLLMLLLLMLLLLVVDNMLSVVGFQKGGLHAGLGRVAPPGVSICTTVGGEGQAACVDTSWVGTSPQQSWRMRQLRQLGVVVRHGSTTLALCNRRCATAS